MTMQNKTIFYDLSVIFLIFIVVINYNFFLSINIADRFNNKFIDIIFLIILFAN